MLLLHLPHACQVLVFVLFLQLLLQRHLHLSPILLLFSVELHAQLLLVLVERIRHFFDVGGRDQFPVIYLWAVLLVDELELLAQWLTEICLGRVLDCALAAYIAKLLDQPVEKGTSIGKCAQIGDF